MIAIWTSGEPVSEAWILLSLMIFNLSSLFSNCNFSVGFCFIILSENRGNVNLYLVSIFFPLISQDFRSAFRNSFAPFRFLTPFSFRPSRLLRNSLRSNILTGQPSRLPSKTEIRRLNLKWSLQPFLKAFIIREKNIFRLYVPFQFDISAAGI